MPSRMTWHDWTLALAFLLLSAHAGGRATASGSPGRHLHVLVPSLPMYGHFLPVKAIAEALVERGHRVTVMLESCEWCAGPVTLKCVTMRHSATFPPELYRNLSLMETAADSWWPMAEELARHQEKEWDAFLDTAAAINHEDPVDLVLFEVITGQMGFAIAHHFDIPYASVYPLVLRLPIDVQSWLPLLGSGHPRELSFLRRWFTFTVNLLLPLFALPSMQLHTNAVREAHGLRPFKSYNEVLGMESLLFAPTIWGFDIPQPICPNVVPVGTLVPKLESVPLEPELKAFLESPRCANGAVYINFGTLSWQTDRAIDQVRLACIGLSSLCCVWKIKESERRLRVLSSLSASDTERFFLSARFASPMAILQHWRTVTFVTHCGDTSLWEAVSAGVPLVGIPFFADQEDVCQRMRESQLGVYVGNKHTFTSADLAEAVLEVAQNRSFSTEEAASLPSPHASSVYLRRIFQVASNGARYGGPALAAAMIESHLELGLLSKPSAGPSPLSCAELQHASQYTINGYWSYLPWIGLHALVYYKVLRYAARVIARAVRCCVR